jgi:uncharacterized protein
MLKRIRLFRYGLGIGLTFILILTLSFMAFGLKPFKINQYVTDNAGLMPEAERAQLSSLLDDYAKQTGNQILVVAIPSLEGEDYTDFTESLFKLNKPGQKGKDNGIILMVALADHKIRIEVGYGLEGPVPDGKAGTIIREQITPYFKAGDYTSGIKAGVYALINAITPDYSLPANQLPQAPVQHESGSFPFSFIIVLIVAVFSFIGSIRGSRTNRGRYRRGYHEPWFWGGGGFGGGSSGGSSFGGGGGFSGGGGGFGGGGAGGSW